MNLTHLAYLQCPTCQAPLSHISGDGEAGWVACEGDHRFAIQQGILDLLGPARPQSMAAQSNEWTITAWAYERLWRPYALTILSGRSFPLAQELDYICGDIRQPHVVIDVACSNGLYARAMQTAFPTAQVIGIDRALPMLHEAQRRARAVRQPISYIRADARALPIVNHIADVVAIGGSWNEMEQLDVVARELQRISRPFATLRSMGLTASSTPFGRMVQQLASTGGVQFPTSDEFIDLLTTYGWHITNMHQQGIVQLIRAHQKG
ncbi:MAG: class I SAM-dependent methyltransferase [Roseiflexaceae bacterium]